MRLSVSVPKLYSDKLVQLVKSCSFLTSQLGRGGHRRSSLIPELRCKEKEKCRQDFLEVFYNNSVYNAKVRTCPCSEMEIHYIPRL